MLHLILHTLRVLTLKIPQSTEETDPYYNGPLLGPVESRNKIPPDANDVVMMPQWQK